MLAILLAFFISSPLEEEAYYYKYCADVYPAIVLTKPSQKATWESPPNIRVCPDTSLDRHRVARATHYWERIGYEFGSIILEKNMYNCLTVGPFRHEIRIMLPAQDFEERYLAMTKLTTHKESGHIARATIYVTPKIASRPRVLEHEIGHALGWRHYPQSRHIMNPDWEAGGYDNYGLKK
jgi:hypothetical protein